MRILGIETSCDETAAAVVDDGRRILSNIIASQIPLHQRFGGVVPEIASRQHVLAIGTVVAQALTAAETRWEEVDAIAVTRGPGLSGALLVGMNFAKGAALARTLPLITVDHIEAHLLSVWLSHNPEPPPEPPLPMVSLVVSGGHTELVLITAPGRYQLLGRTLDDAAGEAFDKVARLLGLTYPGGPAIEQAAANLPPDIEPAPLPRAWLPGTHNFSFSGLKTAVLHLIQRECGAGSDGRGGEMCTLSESQVAAIAAGFQNSVIDVLVSKLAHAVDTYHARSAAIVGGVSGNRALRRAAEEQISVPLYVPERGLSTDNAAMIAGAAFFRPLVVGYDADVDPSLALEASLSA
jgi:N6-L-threonylcarbamoyladenine synthase